MKSTFLLIITVAILQFVAQFCISAGDVATLLDHTIIPETIEQNKYWQRLTNNSPFYDKNLKQFQLNQKENEEVMRIFNQTKAKIKICFSIDTINIFKELLFNGHIEYVYSKTNNIILNIKNYFTTNTQQYTKNFPIFIGVMNSIIDPLEKRFEDEKDKTKELIGQNFCLRFFFSLGLFENMLSKIAKENFDNEEKFNEEKNLFENFAGNFLESKTQDELDKNKLNNDEITIYKKYFVDHITYGFQYFDWYLQNNRSEINNLFIFKNKIDNLKRIFMVDDENFPKVSIYDINLFEKQPNIPKKKFISKWKRKRNEKNESNVIKKEHEKKKKQKKSKTKEELQQNQYRKIEHENNTIKIPTINDDFATIVFNREDNSYNPGSNDYARYIANDKSDLLNIDPKEFEKYGISKIIDESIKTYAVTIDKNYGVKKTKLETKAYQIKIDDVDAKFNPYNQLVNQKLSNPLFSEDIFEPKEMLKAYYQLSPKNLADNVSFAIEDKKTQKLWRAIDVLCQIDLLFNKYKTEEQFIKLCNNINNAFKNNSQYADNISEYLENIKEYAQNLAFACTTQSGLSNDQELQKKIKLINEKVPTLELLSKSKGKKSYFYHWLIGGGIGIAALLTVLHKKNIINIPLFNRIPYLKK